jgi:NAD(P)H-hydrate epimerase
MQEGAPIVVDADSINTLAERGEEGMSLLRGAARQVIITPHPLELSRLTSIPTEEIESARLSVASRIAKDLGVILLLKGAATVVTDGKVTYINSSGSTALAKAGSGDVLAGLIAGLIASSSKGISEVDSARSCVELTALAAYLHGAAADALSGKYSEYALTPSDLPLAIAEVIKGIVG